MSNIMIGAVAKRISSKFNEGDRVKIAKEYGGGTGKVVQVVGGFVVVKTKKGNESYHSSDLKVINGIGAVKSDTIPNDNYLTPTKKLIDSWSKKQAFDYLNHQYTLMYNAQVSNKDYLIKKHKTWFVKKK